MNYEEYEYVLSIDGTYEDYAHYAVDFETYVNLTHGGGSDYWSQKIKQSGSMRSVEKAM